MNCLEFERQVTYMIFKPYCLQALFENIMIELQNEDEGRYTQLLQKMQ
jgi:hypothetical protein